MFAAMNFGLSKTAGWIVFSLITLAFIICKLPDLSLPYFWDEVGVYAPGALAMKDNGTISILPAALDPEYSRGHPLLAVASYAAFFKFFGDGHVQGHIFSLLLAFLTLLLTYQYTAKIFSRMTGLIAVLLLAFTPVFYAMAAIVMPEMMLTLFTVWALFAVIQNRWGQYALASSLAMMCKESAIVIPAAVLFFLFIRSLQHRDFFSWKRWQLFLIAIVPLVVFGLFLVVQKAQNGWYFFPLHVGYIRHDVPSILNSIWYITQDVFIRWGRWLAGIFFIMGLVAATRRKAQQPARDAALLFTSFIALSILFAALNFYLTRYLLYVFPFMMVLAAYGALSLLGKFRPAASWSMAAAFSVAATLLAWKHMDLKKFNDTADMSYRHTVLTQKEAIEWIEAQPWSNSTIGVVFPNWQAVLDPRYGFVKKAFKIDVNCEHDIPYGFLFQLNDEPIPLWRNKEYKILKQWDHLFVHLKVVKFHYDYPTGYDTPN